MWRVSYLWVALVLLGGMLACEKGSMDDAAEIRLLAATINGSELKEGAAEVPLEASVSLIFSAGLEPGELETRISLSSGQGMVPLFPVYSNNTSKVTFELTLQAATNYQLQLDAGKIGVGGRELKDPFTRSFSTSQQDTIATLAPCTSPPECLQSLRLMGSTGGGNVDFYGNYPVYEDKARWKDLTQAVIVVHGAGINPDEYYAWMGETLRVMSLEDSTVLIAPLFRTASTGSGDDLYWSTQGWREGRDSRNANAVSSFAVVDALIGRLADKALFPFMKKIIITGSSSGGLFTHLFASANRSEALFPEMEFHYLVSESQYFYYPTGQRIQESTKELYTPTGCTGYDIWPYGYQVVPEYVRAGVSRSEFDAQFVGRNITYLLGSGSGTDNALNTTDCAAVLLGPTRYQRGENMFRYMDLSYGGVHRHERLVVPGVAHDGAAMYRSAEFRGLLGQVLR